MSLKYDTVVAFGKISFIHRNHTMPGLPDMNLIVIKNEDEYQAICIDIEIDAVGNSLKAACGNLKNALYAYIGQMLINFGNNKKAAVEDIVNTAYSAGNMKLSLFDIYLKTKHRYILDKVSKKNKVKSRKEEFINAWKRAFQFQPIQFNLTPAAGIA